MVDAYSSFCSYHFDATELPLTDVVGGRVDLDLLIEDLDQRYPDNYPDHEMTPWESGRMAGALMVIRYIKSKRNP
jgi:hypothetical protein